VRSDILPALEIGGSAVHVPHHPLWDHEHVADHGEFSELASLADLPEWLRRAA
jgi:putative hydrolase of the HAD superfamily